MPTLTRIIIYPVKSCAGVDVAQATLTRAGLMVDGACDREWMLVDEGGNFLTQREYPRMALIVPRLDGAAVVLRAPGMAELALAPPGAAGPGRCATLAVRVWDDTVPACDCGAAAAAWFSQAIGAPCRLVRFHPEARRLASATWCGPVEAPTRFADAYPVLVAGAASLDDLNRKLLAAGRAALPMDRFRPNLVIDGMDAFEEDCVDVFALGAARLKPVKPCPRCPIPAIDQASGVAGPDPLDILQTYRSKPQLDGAACFGMNCIVQVGEGQRLTVGQQVGATLAW